MKILYLTTHLNIGGIASYCLSLAKGLKAKGHSVYLATSSGELIPELVKTGASFFPIPIRTKSEINIFKIYPSLWRLLPYIKEKEIEIVHSNTRVTQVLGNLIHKNARLAHVYTCHGFFRRNLSRKIFPGWPNKVIAISEPVRENLINDFKLEEDKIVLIHNGIDLDKYGAGIKPEDKQIARARLSLDSGPIVGIIARLSDVKGHAYLIQAMPKILKVMPGVRLLIVGDGRLKSELEVLSNSLGLSKEVIFLPKVADTRQILQALDVFVMPSLKEGLGLGLMEAMALGVPVIGSNVGGIKSLLKAGKNGLLVEPGNSLAIAEAVLELLRDREKAIRLAHNARDFIINNFSLEEMVTKTERVYRECLSVNS
ncbi:MAG: glycosyltransferase family 4 protein [Candidatus Omnitrophica bacterium]|nr:glycosyltransferase family 4 protein [Candidatus Omnitrophota bacterium]